MRIWFPLLAVPLIALADQSVSYATVGWACSHAQPLPLHVLHAVALAATLAGALLAWTLWRETAPAGPIDETVARRHFLAGMGIAASALAALVIGAMWFPTWIIAPCLQ